jgi:predicted nucleotidyltransferase
MEKMDIIDNVEVDYVAHDIGKYALLMLKKNGYVLEQIFSPMVLITSPEHDQLKRLGELCITRHHAFHYLGFAANQWKNIRLPDRSEGNTLPTTPILVKPLLYTYRTLLTGIHIMKSGEIEANLVTLNADSRSAIIDDLIQLKKSGAEHETIDDTDLTHYENLYTKLVSDLETAHQACTLHDIVSRETRLELNELVVNVRLAAV